MSEGSEVRMGLVRHRVSLREFAERCGIGLSELNLMLHSEEDLSDEVRGAYAVLEAGGSGGIRLSTWGQSSSQR